MIIQQGPQLVERKIHNNELILRGSVENMWELPPGIMSNASDPRRADITN